MAALTSADVTLTKIKKQRVGLMRESLYTVAFGDGAKTVPTNGVPLPVLSLFGLKKVDFHQVCKISMNGYVYDYDLENHSIRIYQAGGFTPGGTVTAPVFTGTPLAVHSHDLEFKANAAANAVTMAANSLRNASANALTVVGGGADGGIMDKTGGTPAGDNSVPTFTGQEVLGAPLVHVPTSHAPAATTLRLLLRGK